LAFLTKPQFDRAYAEALAEHEKKGKSKTVSVGQSLCVTLRGGSAVWFYHWREGEDHRTQSLGTYPETTLFKAREARNTLAAKRAAKRIERKGLRVRATTEPGREPKAISSKRQRFADVVEMFIAVKAAEWSARSTEPAKYRKLKDGALGKLYADEIDKNDVEAELTKRWGKVLASAEKYRMRISGVIEFAIAKDFRPVGANPAAKSIMKHLVPGAPRSKPHKAMRSGELPAFMAELAADGSIEARALGFAVLTMTRTAEARDVDWSEIEGDVWTIPGARMKENEEHKVPLSPQALALLGKRKPSGRVFGDLPHDALNDKLNELRPGIGYTVHGFRTTFRGDWALKAGYPQELREMALAHKVGDAVIQAYSLPPSELYTVRIPMTEAWSNFCTGAR
jgi:integrase